MINMWHWLGGKGLFFSNPSNSNLNGIISPVCIQSFQTLPAVYYKEPIIISAY